MIAPSVASGSHRRIIDVLPSRDAAESPMDLQRVVGDTAWKPIVTVVTSLGGAHLVHSDRGVLTDRLVPWIAKALSRYEVQRSESRHAAPPYDHPSHTIFS